MPGEQGDRTLQYKSREKNGCTALEARMAHYGHRVRCICLENTSQAQIKHQTKNLLVPFPAFFSSHQMSISLIKNELI